MRKLIAYSISTIFLLTITISMCAQTMPALIQELCEAKWKGHYQDSEDSSLIHILQWSYLHDGNTVLISKSVPELDFFMDTYLFKDYEKGVLASIALLNRAMVSKGTVDGNDKELIMLGKTFFPDGSRDFRIEYRLNDNGQLEDRFYRMNSEGKWTQGHFIIYESESITAGK